MSYYRPWPRKIRISRPFVIEDVPNTSIHDELAKILEEVPPHNRPNLRLHGFRLSQDKKYRDRVARKRAIIKAKAAAIARDDQTDLSRVNKALRIKLLKLYPELYEDVEGSLQRKAIPESSEIAEMNQSATSGSFEHTVASYDLSDGEIDERGDISISTIKTPLIFEPSQNNASPLTRVSEPDYGNNTCTLFTSMIGNDEQQEKRITAKRVQRERPTALDLRF